MLCSLDHLICRGEQYFWEKILERMIIDIETMKNKNWIENLHYLNGESLLANNIINVQLIMEDIIGENLDIKPMLIVKYHNKKVNIVGKEKVSEFI